MNLPPPPWRPSASRQALEERARLLAEIRAFFAERDVLEVETPVLSAAGNPDPNIAGMRTDAASPRYLRTSPEYPMKRLLAGMGRDIFELGRVFRAGERGRLHNPEFTMLEWYRIGWSWERLADEVIELLRQAGGGRLDDWPSERLTWRELWLRHAGIDPFTASESDYSELASERGISSAPLDLRDWQDLLLTHLVQPALSGPRMTVVCDFPAEQAALATIRPGNPPVAERFEIYLGGVELANGYQELGDATELGRRFEHDNRLRKARGDIAPPVDERLLEALRHGLPACAGVALGVDRLLMARMAVDDIGMTLAFPADRA